MKANPLIFIAILCLLGFSFSGRATELVIGVEDISYLPYNSVDHGEYNGYARELFDFFAKDSGHHITYRPLPVERLFLSLLNGAIDFKFPDNPGWRRELKQNKQVYYSGVVANFVDGVIVTPGRLSNPLNSFRKIGTIRGFTPWALLDAINKGEIAISENNSLSGLLRQTLAGWIDGVYINVMVAGYQLKNVLGRPNSLVFNPNLPHVKDEYLLSTTKHPEIIQEFNQWMTKNSVLVDDLQKKSGIE